LTHALWIILTGSLVAASCGLIGCYLILRKMAMLGDAISHAILPGVVLAFLFSNHLETLYVLVGASLVGLLSTFLIQLLHHRGIQSDAAIGVTFTSLFACGVVLVTRYADQVHLDLQHVLYGEIAYTPWDLVTMFGITMPKAVWSMGAVFLITLLIVGIFYKELKLTSFDPQMAAALGLPVAFIHYLLMSLVSLNTVAAFESVGSILVVAMIVVPGATAYLLTDRLLTMLMLSIVFGVASSVLGYAAAAAFDVSISGAMATVSGLMFMLSFLFSPRHGVLARKWAQRALSRSHAG
jgi:manganese/zinc/iron transport system permease protein